MVNKFCPMCGEGNPIRWFVQKGVPYEWVMKCTNCRFVWVEVKRWQSKLGDFS